MCCCNVFAKWIVEHVRAWRCCLPCLSFNAVSFLYMQFVLDMAASCTWAASSRRSLAFPTVFLCLISPLLCLDFVAARCVVSSPSPESSCMGICDYFSSHLRSKYLVFSAWSILQPCFCSCSVSYSGGGGGVGGLRFYSQRYTVAPAYAPVATYGPRVSPIVTPPAPPLAPPVASGGPTPPPAGSPLATPSPLYPPPIVQAPVVSPVAAPTIPPPPPTAPAPSTVPAYAPKSWTPVGAPALPASSSVPSYAPANPAPVSPPLAGVPVSAPGEIKDPIFSSLSISMCALFACYSLQLLLLNPCLTEAAVVFVSLFFATGSSCSFFTNSSSFCFACSNSSTQLSGSSACAINSAIFWTCTSRKLCSTISSSSSISSHTWTSSTPGTQIGKTHSSSHQNFHWFATARLAAATTACEACCNIIIIIILSVSCVLSIFGWSFQQWHCCCCYIQSLHHSSEYWDILDQISSAEHFPIIALMLDFKTLHHSWEWDILDWFFWAELLVIVLLI